MSLFKNQELLKFNWHSHFLTCLMQILIIAIFFSWWHPIRNELTKQLRYRKKLSFQLTSNLQTSVFIGSDHFDPLINHTTCITFFCSVRHLDITAVITTFVSFVLQTAKTTPYPMWPSRRLKRFPRCAQRTSRRPTTLTSLRPPTMLCTRPLTSSTHKSSIYLHYR